jgi:hypothetical protein
VSKEDIDKKDFDKRVRALTTLTKDDEIPALTADFFNSAHPLPAVCALLFINFSFVHLLVFCCYFPDSFVTYFCAGHQLLVSRPPLPEEGPIQADPIFATSEAPEAEKAQDGDDAKVSLEESSSTTSPPPANLEEPSLDKKRKHLDELLSSSTSAPKNTAREPSAPNPSEVEIFDALDS